MRRARAKTLLTISLLCAWRNLAAAQDAEYIRAVERAQQQRPSTIAHSSRIAPHGEQGTPLILDGRIVNADGTAAAGTIVFAYHTDQAGLYDRPKAGPHSWRLKGWARADDSGAFTFETIRPGPYPDGQIPAHVHFTAFTPSGERFHAGEVKFEDDPLLPPSERVASQRAGDFGEVRPVRRDGDLQHVAFALRIDLSQRF